jgi:hypothetical protein
MRNRKYAALVAFALLCGLLVVPSGTAGAIPIFPGNPGNLQVIFDNTGEPAFNTGLAATGVGAFRMNTGSGTGANAGGKVFLHSTEVDNQPVTALTSMSAQYFIDPTSPVQVTPYFNLRVEGSFGARTLTTTSAVGVPTGQFATINAPTGATAGWTVTGAVITCGAVTIPDPVSLEFLDASCPGTTIVPTSGALLGGVSIVTGTSDGANPNWVGWTGVIDDVHINASVYDLEPARVTITPTSPVALSSRNAQTVSFTLRASGWNSFLGLDTTGVIPQLIVFGTDLEVGFSATGAGSASGPAATFPAATTFAQLQSPPPEVTFDLAVTDALIGDVDSIDVAWDAVNAVPDPATTVLQLPPLEPVSPGVPGEDLVGLVDPETGVWSLRGAAGGVTTFFYGDPGDVPFVGDWDGDGIDTPGLYRQSDGFVYLRNSNSQGIADIRFFFGNPGDIPMAGDFDNDGFDTVGIYRPSNTTFYVINELGANNGGLGPADFSFIFGNPEDKPFVGDFNNDGIDTIGLHRESTGIVYFRQTNTTGIADAEFFYGDPDDRFVAGDWVIVDGIDTPGVFRPSNATFFLRDANTQGVGDVSFPFGDSNDLPIAGIWGP